MTAIPRRVSLVAQTCTALRESIAAGVWRGELPGELELCRLLHVSRVTLRAALGRLEQEGVLAVAKGRRRSILGKSRASGPVQRPQRVVLLSPVSLSGLTATKLLWIDALREQVAGMGLPLEVLVSGAASQRRPERRLAALRRQHPDAVWILLRSTEGMQRWFAAQGLSAIVAGSRFPDVALPCVDFDYHAVSRHAAGRLAARGCRRPGLVMPHEVLAGDAESEAGFRSGCGDGSVVVVRHDGTPDGLIRGLDAAMSGRGAPDGLFVFHAPHAVTVVTRLLQLGRRLPQDVRLVARDDDPVLDHLSPRPARYAAPPAAFASRIARLVGRWLDGETPAARRDLILPDFMPGQTL